MKGKINPINGTSQNFERKKRQATITEQDITNQSAIE